MRPASDWLPGQPGAGCAPHNFYFWFGLLCALLVCCSVRSEGQSADEGHLWAISNQQAQPSNQGNNGTPSLAELLPQFYSSLAFTTTPELVRPVPVHRWQGGAYIIYVDTYVSLSHIRSLLPHYYIVEWCEGQPSRGVRTLIIQAPGSHNTPIGNNSAAPVNVL